MLTNVKCEVIVLLSVQALLSICLVFHSVGVLEQDKEKATAAGIEPPQAEAGFVPYIRPLTMADMRQAMEKVR